MSTTSIIMQGTIRPDGTLELDQKVQLPAGRVQLTIRPAPESKPDEEDWWQNLQKARILLEARGIGSRSQAEIEADRDAFRSEN